MHRYESSGRHRNQHCGPERILRRAPHDVLLLESMKRRLDEVPGDFREMSGF
jgi:hypothetical protein